MPELCRGIVGSVVLVLLCRPLFNTGPVFVVSRMPENLLTIELTTTVAFFSFHARGAESKREESFSFNE